MPVIIEDLVMPEPDYFRREDLGDLRPADAHDSIWDAELDGQPATPAEQAYFGARDQVETDELFGTMAGMQSELRPIRPASEIFEGMY
jgi:hypothetical protein